MTMAWLPGPSASEGVQVNRPLVGLMAAPAGAPGSRLYVNDCGGVSESVAEFVTVSVLPSATVRLSSGASVGALFTSLTVTVKERVALRFGVPSSVTRTVIG